VCLALPGAKCHPLCSVGLVALQYDQVLAELEHSLHWKHQNAIGSCEGSGHHLEVAQVHRQLAVHEELLRQELKLKSLGRLSLQRTISRQELCLLWLREGDAATKFFHIHASTHRRKMPIRSLECDGRVLMAEEQKVEVVYAFLDEVLGKPSLCIHTIDMPHLVGLLPDSCRQPRTSFGSI
jgi:hypothetical protein